MELSEFIKQRNIEVRDDAHLRVINCFYPYLRSVSGNERLLPSVLERILGIDLPGVLVITACFNGVNDGSKPPYDNVDLYIKLNNGIKVFVYGRKQEPIVEPKENEYAIFIINDSLDNSARINRNLFIGEGLI